MRGPRPMRRHELDPVSLVFGFAFTGLGLLFLIGQADQALRLRWIWPLLLLALGAGILLDVTRGRSRTDPEAELAPVRTPPRIPTPPRMPDLSPSPTTGARARPGAERAVDDREHPS